MRTENDHDTGKTEKGREKHGRRIRDGVRVKPKSSTGSEVQRNQPAKNGSHKLSQGVAEFIAGEVRTAEVIWACLKKKRLGTIWRQL